MAKKRFLAKFSMNNREINENVWKIRKEWKSTSSKNCRIWNEKSWPSPAIYEICEKLWQNSWDAIIDILQESSWPKGQFQQNSLSTRKDMTPPNTHKHIDLTYCTTAKTEIIFKLSWPMKEESGFTWKKSSYYNGKKCIFK